MPGIALMGDVTTGHDGYPPTDMIATPVSKTKIQGKYPGVVDPACQFRDHNKGPSVHPAALRTPEEGSSKTFIEGFKVARIADKLKDGDVIAGSSDNSFIE